MAIDNTAVIHAYRHLYRGLLQAVQFSMPARIIGRNHLRAAFRARDGPGLDGEGVKRTLWFLQAAARERGLEHKLLKNLLRVQSELQEVKPVDAWRRAVHQSKSKPSLLSAEKETAMAHYRMTIAMLNKTMGLCLR